jgi:potassium voltage-gated channel Eag-related subfamily H protein 5
LSPGPASLARQDTIDETGEGEMPQREPSLSHRPSIQLEHRADRQRTERDPLLDSHEKERVRERERERERQIERNLSLERERQIEMAKARETTSDNYDTGLREQPSTLAQRDLIATVLDMKVDVRLEMQRMSQRISRIEDLLNDLVSRIVQDSSESSPSGETVPLPGGTTTATTPTGSTLTVAGATSAAGGNGLGPILLRKRRSKNRRAPPPPKLCPEQTRLIETPELPSTSTRKREFL